MESLKPVAISDKPIYVSQGFGEHPEVYNQFGHKGHNGLDIAAPSGTHIYATHDGQLTFSKDPKGYGNYARIKDSEKETVYAHMSKFEGVNRSIKTGDLIGYVGTTGFSTGNHLHFGLKPIPSQSTNGYSGSIDPVPFMETNMNQAKVVKSKVDGSIYVAYEMPDMDYLKKKAALEGFTIPNPIPTVDNLQ